MSSSARRVVRMLVLVLVLASCTLPITGAGARRAAAASASVSIGAGLRGPSGLSASVYAKGLKHVSALATDLQGRVWAATAAAKDAGNDAIYVVSRAGATPQRIVTDVHTPLGLLWIGDTVYVAQADEIVALSGFDGSAFASRTTVVSFPEGTGEVNGITLGRDGRLYVGISAPCNACTVTDTYSASIVSFLPDGSDVQVYARGIRAPVGLAFYPGTDDLFVTMNQRDDLGAKTPGDWLSLVHQGESWGFPAYWGQSGARWSAMPRPVAALDRHAAVSGVAIVTGQLGSGVGTGAVVAEWATGAVRLVHLTASGDGFTGVTVSFLRGFANPVPVLLDAHGALFVGDWTRGTITRVSG